MKNVFLIGDSIRYGSHGAIPPSPGYGLFVAEMLLEQANVYMPNENCRFAQYTLRYLRDWSKQVPAQDIDVVHWNAGLWDVLQLDGDDPFTPIDFYLHTLKRIDQSIRKLFPNARIVFATSTPVIESLAKPGLVRRNSVIQSYNFAAKELMRELNVPIDDLYEIAATFDDKLHSDWVHFNSEGSKLLAKAVIQSLQL